MCLSWRCRAQKDAEASNATMIQMGIEVGKQHYLVMLSRCYGMYTVDHMYSNNVPRYNTVFLRARTFYYMVD